MSPFGTADYGLLGVIFLLIALFVVTEFKDRRQPVLRMILVATSVYMITLVTSGLGVISFTAFGMYNLFEILRK